MARTLLRNVTMPEEFANHKGVLLSLNGIAVGTVLNAYQCVFVQSRTRGLLSGPSIPVPGGGGLRPQKILCP